MLASLKMEILIEAFATSATFEIPSKRICCSRQAVVVCFNCILRSREWRDDVLFAGRLERGVLVFWGCWCRRFRRSLTRQSKLILRDILSGSGFLFFSLASLSFSHALLALGITLCPRRLCCSWRSTQVVGLIVVGRCRRCIRSGCGGLCWSVGCMHWRRMRGGLLALFCFSHSLACKRACSSGRRVCCGGRPDGLRRWLGLSGSVVCMHCGIANYILPADRFFSSSLASARTRCGCILVRYISCHSLSLSCRARRLHCILVPSTTFAVLMTTYSSATSTPSSTYRRHCISYAESDELLSHLVRLALWCTPSFPVCGHGGRPGCGRGRCASVLGRGGGRRLYAERRAMRGHRGCLAGSAGCGRAA